MGNKIYHLAVRYTEDMYAIDQVIERHNQIALRHEMVWVGKAFHKMGQVPIDIINKQIKDGLEPRLFFINTQRVRPVAHYGKLLNVTMKSPGDKEFIPPFYKQKKILSRMKVWMKVSFLQGFYLSDLPELEKMNRIYDEAEALADGSRGHFMVYEEI